MYDKLDEANDKEIDEVAAKQIEVYEATNARDAATRALETTQLELESERWVRAMIESELYEMRAYATARAAQPQGSATAARLIARIID